MEEQKETDGGAKELKQDRLVEKLLLDLSQEHPDVRILVGYVGRSSQPEYWRLYLTPVLDVYVEIPQDAIVHSQSLANEQNPMGGTMLWVKHDTDVVLCRRTNLRQRQGQFLSGEIVSQADRRGMTGAEAASLAATGSKAMHNPIAYWWASWALSICFLCPTDLCDPKTLLCEGIP